ncbi:MAG TPA: hypothetical protein VG604_04360 [Candidatus Saccharimonadales bacterium]|nr:hypothetical protein [Candidatus Saccharimonadales bacterium]
MNSSPAELKKSFGFIGSLRYSVRVGSLRRQIRKLQSDPKIKELELAIQNEGLLDGLGGISLYFDHVEKSGRKIMFSSPLDAQIQTDGNVYATSKTSGGGSRPSLTRTVAGGLLLGPVGAVAGAATQKHGKITTQTTVHDDRTVVIDIGGQGGYINEVLPYSQSSRARDFMTTVLNVSYDYRQQKPRLTAAKYMENLRVQLAEQAKLLGISRKQRELAALQEKRANDDQKWRAFKAGERSAKQEKRTKERSEKQKLLAIQAKNVRKNRQLKLAAFKQRMGTLARSVRSALKKWYTRNPAIIAMIVIFFPVGLLLMWKYADWAKATKWIITLGMLSLMVIGLIGGDQSSSSKPTLKNKNSGIIYTSAETFGL